MLAADALEGTSGGGGGGGGGGDGGGDDAGDVCIIGFGSLLSRTSALTTFPELKNFRVGRIRDWRRTFSHAATIFFERDIANLETREFSSLSVEPHDGAVTMVTVFDIPRASLPAFLAREEEFDIQRVAFEDVGGGTGFGLCCCRATDEHYISVKGQAEFDSRFKARGLHTIYNWDRVLPCRLYLRHCVLAATSLGDDVRDNFLDHTWLWDRKTTVREYLADHPDLMTEEPPERIRGRYSG